MSDEINYTSAASPRDYAITLRALSDRLLAEQAELNHWCWKHIQNTEIDYHARYQACITLQLQREHDRRTPKF